MSYNMTPTCIICGRTRIPYNDEGIIINDEWTCFRCIIKAQETEIAKLRAGLERVRELVKWPLENNWGTKTLQEIAAIAEQTLGGKK